MTSGVDPAAWQGFFAQCSDPCFVYSVEGSAQFRLAAVNDAMPELDGFAASEELRRIDPRVRVVLMSGYNEQDAMARFAGSGLAGFVQKPFTADQLGEKLRQALRSA
jgi:CheY-like chemotaxis protein